MGYTYFIVGMFVASAFIATKSEDIPNYIHVCHRDDAKLSECMAKSIEILRPYLKQGIPELDIAPIEPFELGDLIVAEKTPTQGLSITAKDIRAWGASNFILKKINVVEYARRYTFDLHFPQLYVEGQYALEGQVLFIPVRGEGKFTGNFTDAVGSVKIKSEVIRVNDEDHVSVSKLTIKIKVQDGRLHLNNLFGGDKLLGDIVNETINQNFDLFIKDIIPLIEKSLGKKFRKVGNKIIERYSEKQLFP